MLSCSARAAQKHNGAWGLLAGFRKDLQDFVTTRWLPQLREPKAEALVETRSSALRESWVLRIDLASSKEEVKHSEAKPKAQSRETNRSRIRHDVP